MSLYRNPAVLLEQLGEAYTLRRKTVAAGANSWTAGAGTITYYPQRGQVRIGDPNAGTSMRNDARGLARDAQAVHVLSPDYEAPQQGDQVAPGTYTSDAGVEWLEIVYVEKVRIEGHLAKYYAHVRH